MSLPQSVRKLHRVLLLDHHPTHSGSCDFVRQDHSQARRYPRTPSPLQHILVLVHPPPPHQEGTTKTTALIDKQPIPNKSPVAARTCQFIIYHSPADLKNANNLQLLLLLFPGHLLSWHNLLLPSSFHIQLQVFRILQENNQQLLMCCTKESDQTLWKPSSSLGGPSLTRRRY